MRVYKANPDFGMYLAEQAVRLYFHGDERSRQRMADFCRREAAEAPNLWRVYLRVQRRQVDCMAVGAVLRSLPDIMQRFVYYRYGLDESYVRIEGRLHASVSLLNEWNRDFLSAVERMLFYAVGKGDVYSRLKLLNLLHVLDIRINALLESGLPVDAGFLAVLSARRRSCRCLVREMDACLRRAGESVYYRVVAAKLENPHSNQTEIAQRIGYSSGCVGKNLRRYEERMRRYMF